MGWFWASTAAKTGEEPVLVTPPKHTLTKEITGTFWAPRADIWAQSAATAGGSNTNDSQPKCPVDHTKWAQMAKPAAKEASKDTQSACPVDHSKFSQPKFNQLNNMPSLHQHKLPNQKVDLPTERSVSSIPRGKDGEGFWEYPSPQQMLNAMVRKSGPDGIEEDAVESMVDVHNFLNEGVWEEVLEWEKPHTLKSHVTPRLLKFQGRPGEYTPKARIIQALGWVYPAKFGVPPPFDRHDWTVLRAVPGTEGEFKEVRYVIDFYEVPVSKEDTTFTVDVRPAADSLENISDRIKVAWGPSVRKALGWQ